MKKERLRAAPTTDPMVAFQRSRVYELLAHALSEPSSEFLDFVRSGEFLSSMTKALQSHPSREPVDPQPLAEATGDVKEAAVDDVSSWHLALVSPRLSLIYECKYHSPLNSMQEMADIAGFYKAFGLGFEDDRADHLCMELEFMRLLALKESKALLDGYTDKAEICISAQRDFIVSHLGRWVDSLALITEGCRFYSPVCRFLARWMAAECQYHLAEPEEIYYTFSDKDDVEDSAPAACVKEAD